MDLRGASVCLFKFWPGFTRPSEEQAHAAAGIAVTRSAAQVISEEEVGGSENKQTNNPMMNLKLKSTNT